ncbi:MAG: hypothetical protein V6010_01060 [Candidatus Dasytiphilus stammeri]
MAKIDFRPGLPSPCEIFGGIMSAALDIKIENKFIIVPIDEIDFSALY